MSNETTNRRSKLRQINRTRSEYFKKYYSETVKQKHLDAMNRIMVMKNEAGYLKKYAKKTYIEKRSALLSSKRIVYVDGVKLVQWSYAINHLVKNLAASTKKHYMSMGYIPKPMYKLPHGSYHWYYYSMRQVGLLNRTWPKKRNKKGMRGKFEYLHAHWKDEKLLGSEIPDGGNFE